MAQLFGLARIGRDVEVRHTAGGDPVASISLAFSYGKKDPATGKRPTEWVDGALWGPRAEALAPYLLKGTAVSVTVDDVHIETYEGRNGTGHKLVGRVTSIEFAGGGQQAQQGEAPARQSPQQRTAPSRQQTAPAADFSDLADEIPF